MSDKTETQLPTEGGSSPRPCSPFAGVTNLAYIVIFLRNGGERLRAIWLAKTTLGISIQEAKEWVDSVNLIRGPKLELLPEIPPNDHQPSKVASHWPPTVEAIMKANASNGATRPIPNP